MGLARGVGCVVVLVALGRGALGAGPQGREAFAWPATGVRDPFEYGPPDDGPPPRPPTTGLRGVELAQHVEDLLSKGDLDGAERLVESAQSALRGSGAEDAELAARLGAASARTRQLRAEAEALEAVRRLRLEVGAVAWGKTNPVALVNGVVCRPGDVVEGARIERILPGEVIFVFNGVEIRKSVLRRGPERAGDVPAAGGPGEPE